MRLKNWTRYPQGSSDSECMNFSMCLFDGTVISIMNNCLCGGGWSVSSSASHGYYGLNPILDIEHKYNTLDEAELAAIEFLQIVKNSCDWALTET